MRRSSLGKQALSRFKKFWSLKGVPSLKILPGKKMVLVGMGRSPAVTLADGPSKKQSRKIVRRKHRGILAASPSGRRMYIITSARGIPKKPRLKLLGWCPTTEYIPSKDLERSGTPKKGKHWVHQHTEGGGRWPKIYQDQSGNYHYGRGTYAVSDWIRK